MKRSIIFSAIVSAFLTAAVAHAAVITVQQGAAANTAVVSLDTQGQSINTLDIHLSFNQDAFSIASVNDGGSIVNVWITPPTFSNVSGTVDFTGIIPGGIQTASGTILTLTLAPLSSQPSASFSLASGTALLNDGEGSPAKVIFISDGFPLENTTSSPSLAVDTTPPNPFTPEIATDPSLFGGRYFLVFATTDQGSGIDHYEVLEGSGVWQRATSPYLLTDQSLSSNIYVRAVDRAGNFRVAEIPAPHPASARTAILWSVLGVVALCALLLWGSIWLYTWKRRSKA